MAERPPLKSYTFEGYYSDDPDESGPRTDCELAPDRATAVRLAAVSILEDNQWTLAGKGYETLEDFHDNEITVSYEWVQGETGKVCPNCTSDQVRPNGKHFDLDGATREVLECKACGFESLPLGFVARRAELDEFAWKMIGQLDAYEKLSLEYDDWDEMPELPEEQEAVDA
jgi:hypothetical protein